MDDENTTPSQSNERPEQPYSTADYERYTPPAKRKSKGRRVLAIVLIVVLIIIAGAAVYWFLLRPEPVATTTNPKQQSQHNSSGSTTPKVAAPTQHYDSTNLQLGFDYPKDWTVTDTAGSNKLTAASPATQLTDASGQTTTGQITMAVLTSSQQLPGFATGDATAAIASQKIAYTNPTASQRGNTYISFLRYASDTNGNGLDGVYITGDAGYELGQNIPKTDIAKVSPIVNITFTKCSDSTCAAAGTPLSIAASSWDNDSFSGPLLNILKSFSFE